MYSVAVMPILWGAAIAYADTGRVAWGNLLLFLGAAVLILAWENLANDVFDSETGIDVNKHHSVVNLTGNKALVLGLANGVLALGLVGIGAIAWGQRDGTVLVLVLGCCGLGYLYQGPPFRLGYQGLGEILCFVAFGPLAVGAAYYAQTQQWSGSALMLSVFLGITTSLILFCSHFHQLEDDLAAGKRSPIVRLGTERAAHLLPWLCAIAYGALGGAIALGDAPIGAGFGLLGLPWAIQLCRHVQRYHAQPDRVSNCKFIAVGFHFWSGLGLVLGLVLDLSLGR